MQLSEKQLTEARDTVQALLEQLGLAAYLFEVEPRRSLGGARRVRAGQRLAVFDAERG